MSTPKSINSLLLVCIYIIPFIPSLPLLTTIKGSYHFQNFRGKVSMEAIDSVLNPLRESAKDSVMLVMCCHKPDPKEFSKLRFVL